MRAVIRAVGALAEWVVGLLVLAYVMWGMCVDRARARANRHTETAANSRRRPILGAAAAIVLSLCG